MKRSALFWQVLVLTSTLIALILFTIWLGLNITPELRTPGTTLPQSTIQPVATLTSIATIQACNTTSYDVQANDTLSKIAETYSVSVDELITHNGLHTDMLLIGQRLLIPVCKQSNMYNWHGINVSLAVDFPKSLVEAPLKTYSVETPATIEMARKLAERFDIQGEVYLDSSNALGAQSFIITDDKQSLFVNSEHQFRYQTGFTFHGASVSLETARHAIDAFLKAHGFNFEYQLDESNRLAADRFQITPLDGENRKFFLGAGQTAAVQAQIDRQGQVIGLNYYELNENPQPVGQFRIISAEQAWQQVLQDAPLGILQRMSSDSRAERLFWRRTYPNDTETTIYGRFFGFQAAENGKPPILSIEGHFAIGATSGMENLPLGTYLQAQGRFVSENGVQKFKVATWQTLETYPQPITGSLRKDGDKFIFSAQGLEYSLSDVPAEVPTPVDNITISGFVNGTQLDWQNIMYAKDRTQGGKESGDFAKLNLSGAPVVWPTPVAAPIPLNAERIDGQRGTLRVLIYQKADGSSQHTEYHFYIEGRSYRLQGLGLDRLQAYQNLPVIIWGAVTESNENQMPVITVERYEVPFPNLKFQVLRGTQKIVEQDGLARVLFTAEDGKTYLQADSNGMLENHLAGNPDDFWMFEALLVPGETFYDYPVIRTFSGTLAISPTTGKPFPLEIRANTPYLWVDNSQSGGPALTIESIELIDYTADPRYAIADPQAIMPYIQPVWRFYGHYRDGSEMEILVQALKQEYLLPEASPAIPGR